MRKVSMMMRKRKERSKQVESKGREPHPYLHSILLMRHAESMIGAPEIWNGMCTLTAKLQRMAGCARW